MQAKYKYMMESILYSIMKINDMEEWVVAWMSVSINGSQRCFIKC